MAQASGSLGNWLKGAAVALTLCLAVPPTPAKAIIDCSIGGCFDASTLPPSGPNDIAEVIRSSWNFFGVNPSVYIVSASEVRATLPYLLPEQEGIGRDQIHIPEIYHASIELQHAGARHFIWHYIIGHEMAHAFQKRTKLLNALDTTVFRSVVLAELHADFLAGFFLARRYGLDILAIDQLAAELEAIPSGTPGDPHYHGAPRQRYFVMTQGALFALRRPTPTLSEANAEGIGAAFDQMPQ